MNHGSHYGICMPALESPNRRRLCSPQWCTKELNRRQTQVLHSIGIHVNECPQHLYDNWRCGLSRGSQRQVWYIGELGLERLQSCQKE